MLIRGAQRELAEFDRRLRAGAPEGQARRPFLCRGSPLGCDVFLVGINPGTDTPLWPHWSPENGCDKDGWLAEYLSRHGRLKPTRARIERICEAAGRDRVLETNVFHVPSAREHQLAKADRRTASNATLGTNLRSVTLSAGSNRCVGLWWNRSTGTVTILAQGSQSAIASSLVHIVVRYLHRRHSPRVKTHIALTFQDCAA